MKKPILILIISISFFLKSNAQWETLHFISDSIPFPWVNSISFSNSKIGFAACSGAISYTPFAPSTDDIGAIIKTIDGGVSWSNAYSLDTASFVDITYSDSNSIIAIGCKYGISNIIAKSTNNGLSWDTIMTPVILNSISFPSPEVGYISANSDIVLKTIDYGNNWTILHTGFPIIHYKSKCLFINDTIGFVIGESQVIKTTNGGNSWEVQNFSTVYDPIMDICFSSLDTGYFLINLNVGIDSWGMGIYIYKLFRTIDTGIHWDYISDVGDTNAHGMFAMRFPTNDIGYIAGQFQMYKTIDGGFNWERQYATPPGWLDFMDDLTCLNFISADSGFAAGSSQFYRTYNGGETINSIANDSNVENVSISIYPNPTSGNVFIRSDEDLNVRVYNLLGKIIYVGNTKVDNCIKLSTQGIYLFELSNDKNMVFKKVVVQ